MRLAIISDIHGNYNALEAFLAFLKEHPVDGIIGLGDYVTDCPYPERIMELLRRTQEIYSCVLLRGNREEYLIENRKMNRGWRPSSQNGGLFYTDIHLTEADIRFFEGLATERALNIEGYPELMLCHGVPGMVRGNVRTEEGLKDRVLATLPNRYLLGGHTHYQEVYHSADGTYINPGSLGLAIDGVGRRAQFAILTGDREGWKPELFSIPYDVEGLLRDFASSGIGDYAGVLNRSIIKTLQSGINYFFACVELAAERAGLPLSEIPESVWEEAAVELGF